MHESSIRYTLVTSLLTVSTSVHLNNVSVVSFCGVARGVSESGVFYPLDHVDLQPFTSLGISNEIVDEEAVITVEDGTLIVVESRD